MNFKLPVTVLSLFVTQTFANDIQYITIDNLTNANFEIKKELNYQPTKNQKNSPRMASALIAKDGKQLSIDSMYFLPQALNEKIDLESIDKILLEATQSRKKTPERGLYCFMTLQSSDYLANSKINPKAMKIDKCFKKKIEKTPKAGWSFKLISIEENVNLYGCFMSDSSLKESPLYQMGCISYSTDKEPTVKNFLNAMGFDESAVSLTSKSKLVTPTKVTALKIEDTCETCTPAPLKVIETKSTDNLSKVVETIQEKNYSEQANSMLFSFLLKLKASEIDDPMFATLIGPQFQAIKDQVKVEAKKDVLYTVASPEVVQKMHADKNYSKLVDFLAEKDLLQRSMESKHNNSQVITAVEDKGRTLITIKYNKEDAIAVELTCQKVETKTGKYINVVTRTTDGCLVSNVIIED